MKFSLHRPLYVLLLWWWSWLDAAAADGARDRELQVFARQIIIAHLAVVDSYILLF